MIEHRRNSAGPAVLGEVDGARRIAFLLARFATPGWHFGLVAAFLAAPLTSCGGADDPPGPGENSQQNPQQNPQLGLPQKPLLDPAPDNPPGETAMVTLNGLTIPPGLTVLLFEGLEEGGSSKATNATGEGAVDLESGVFAAGRMMEPWLVGQLIDHAAAGRLNLDGPIAEHLPFFGKPPTSFVTPRQLIEHTAHLGGEPYDQWILSNSYVPPLKCQHFLANLGCDDTPGERPVWRASHVDTMGWLCGSLGTEPPSHIGLKNFASAMIRWRSEFPRSFALREEALGAGFESILVMPSNPDAASGRVAVAAGMQGDVLKAAAVAGGDASSDQRLQTAREFIRSKDTHVGRSEPGDEAR